MTFWARLKVFFITYLYYLYLIKFVSAVVIIARGIYNLTEWIKEVERRPKLTRFSSFFQNFQ